MNKKITKAEVLVGLIRMCEEFDRKKNNEKQLDAFLTYIAHQLELILGGYYE